MKFNFIHAVVFGIDEFNDGGYDTNDWSDLTSADYTVHCLYLPETNEIIYLDDNIHTHIEDNIENFYRGLEFCGFDAQETRAYIVVDNGLSYNKEVVGLYLNEGKYVEV